MSRNVVMLLLVLKLDHKKLLYSKSAVQLISGVVQKLSRISVKFKSF